jgi:hypothetical protein
VGENPPASRFKRRRGPLTACGAIDIHSAARCLRRVARTPAKRGLSSQRTLPSTCTRTRSCGPDGSATTCAHATSLRFGEQLSADTWTFRAFGMAAWEPSSSAS